MQPRMEIRAATEQDAEFVAWVMHEAARSGLPVGVWDAGFPGPDAQRLHYLAQLSRQEPVSYAHYQHFLVATVDGEPAAALSRFEPGKTGVGQLSDALATVLTEAGWSPDHLRLLTLRFAPAMACMPSFPEDHFIVEFVAARPEQRGKGIVHALLQHVLAEGKALGYRNAQLAVLLGNLPAIRCYERVGFTLVDQKLSASFEELFGTPGVGCMRRPL